MKIPNISSSDFFTLRNKAYIREQIIDAYKIENQDKIKSFFITDLKSYPDISIPINKFVEEFPIFVKQIFNLVFPGIGSGEVLLYFLCDEVCLSGFKSRIDIYVNEKPFCEVKTLNKLKNGGYNDFRFGTTTSEFDKHLINELINFISHSENSFKKHKNKLEFNSKLIAELRRNVYHSDEHNLHIKILNENEIFIDGKKLCNKNDPNLLSFLNKAFSFLSSRTANSFKEIENEYFYNVFKFTEIGKQNFVFFDRKNFKCVYFGKIKRHMLKIERVTQGVVKPFIKFNNSNN